MTNAANRGSGEAVLNEAAAWFTQLNEADGAARAGLERDFRAWLAADPANAEAFARVTDAWNAIEPHALAPEMMALRRDALDEVQNAARARWRTGSSVRSWGAIAAALVCLFCAGVLMTMTLVGAGDRYMTAVGERRTVTLADNSRVAIDADSVISVVFEERLRLVRLEKGQAFFDVEKDPTRPFVVEAGGRRVVALGTAFNVELLGGELRVTLVEGRVAVRAIGDRTPLTLPGSPMPVGVKELKPGEQLTALGRSAPRIAAATNLAATTSWREGKLIFDDEPLGDALARVQRYSRVRMTLADRKLNAIRISGVFNTGDVNAFVGAVQAYYPVDAITSEANEIILRERR